MAVLNETSILIIGGAKPDWTCLYSTEIFTYGQFDSTYGPAMVTNAATKSASLALNSTHVLHYGGRTCDPKSYQDVTWLFDLEKNETRLVSTSSAGEARWEMKYWRHSVLDQISDH